MEAALKTVRSLCQPGRAVAVLGDMLELGSHETQEHVALGEKTAQHVDFAAFFGPRAQKSYEAAKATGTPCAHFVEVEALLAWLLPQLKAGDMVLVKGSRGMRLERVVQALTGERMGEAH